MTAAGFGATLANALFAPEHLTGLRLMCTAARLLARGKPVTVSELATVAGVDIGELSTSPASEDIEYDDEGRIIGWGLTLTETAHRYIVNGQVLYTWCAADTLLFPAVLRSRARIESRCPVTDSIVRLVVDPHTGIADLSPATAVISIPGIEELDVTKVRATGCNPGRYFAAADATEDWLLQHPSGTVLTVTDAYTELRPIGRRFLQTLP